MKDTKPLRIFILTTTIIVVTVMLNEKVKGETSSMKASRPFHVCNSYRTNRLLRARASVIGNSAAARCASRYIPVMSNIAAMVNMTKMFCVWIQFTAPERTFNNYSLKPHDYYKTLCKNIEKVCLTLYKMEEEISDISWSASPQQPMRI